MDQPDDPNQQQHIMNNNDDEPMNRSIKQEVIEEDDNDDDDDDEYYEEQLVHDNSPSHDSQAIGHPDGDDAFASSYSLPPTADPGEQHFSDGNNGQDYEEDEQSDSDVLENEQNLPDPIDRMQSAQMSEPGLNVPTQSNGYVPRPLVNDVLVDQDLAALAVAPMTPSESTLTANAMGFLRGTYLDDPDIADSVTENVVMVGDFIGNFCVNCEGSFEGMFREVHLREFKCVFKGKVTEGFLRGTFRGAVERLFTGETHFEGRFSGVLVGDFDGRMTSLVDAVQERNAAMRAYRRPIRLPTRIQSVAPSMDAQSVNDHEVEHLLTVNQTPNHMPNDQLIDAQLPEPSNHLPERNGSPYQDNIQSVNQSHLVSSAESSATNGSGTNNDLVGTDTLQQQQPQQQQRKSFQIVSKRKQPQAQSPPSIEPEVEKVKLTRLIRDISTTKSVIFIQCPECEARVATFEALFEHLGSNHNQLPYPCFVDGCTERFNMNKVTPHLKNKHPQATNFSCPVSDCRKKFLTQEKASTHYRLHTKGEFKCIKCACNRQMLSLPAAKQHLKTQIGTGSGCESEKCGATFDTLKALEKHHNNHHLARKTVHYCILCNLCSFAQPPILDHLQSDHQIPIYARSKSHVKFIQIQSKSSLDKRIKSMSKRPTKLPMAPSSAASSRANDCGPSTSGTQSSRHVDVSDNDDDRDDDDDYDDDNDDFIVTTNNKHTKRSKHSN